ATGVPATAAALAPRTKVLPAPAPRVPSRFATGVPATTAAVAPRAKVLPASAPRVPSRLAKAAPEALLRPGGMTPSERRQGATRVTACGRTRIGRARPNLRRR